MVDEQNHRRREVADILLSVGAVSINVAEPFTYGSGTRSPIYCDNRMLMSYPPERRRIIDYFAEMIEHEIGLAQVEVLAGVATSGIPWAAWIAEALGRPMVYVRAGAKEYGKRKQIEGVLGSSQRAVVVEDLVSTGASALTTAEGVRAGGATARDCVAIFTYELPVAQAAFREADVRLLTLSGISTLLDVAGETGRLSASDRAAVEDWLQGS